jgi:exodeoxyribonuclease V beta subunit
VAWLEQSIRSESDRELRLESEADAVTISTIHRAKGLEWPIVFCPFLLLGSRIDQGRYHDPSQPGKRLYALIADAESRQRIEEEALQEDARLLYVALTRARHHLAVGLPLLENPAKSGLFHLLFDLTSHREKDTDTHTLYKELKKELASLTGDEGRELFSFCESPPLPSQAWLGRTKPALAEPHRLGVAVDRRFRIGSYSGLLLRAPIMEKEQDRNDPSLPEGSPGVGLQEDEPVPGEILLKDFPKGPRAGEVIHSILEHGSFPAGFKAEELGRALERFGIDAIWTAPLLQALEAVLDFPLPFGSLRLVTEDHRLNEMEFLLPLLGRESLSASRLAAAFRHHPSPKLPPKYVEDLARLNFPSLRGFFKGFIDLVFRHNNRYYLVDYKSNFLGPNWTDYGPQRLGQAMAHHHYFLQYHLYVVALIRHLRALSPDFDYRRDFGGVYYLFLRGMVQGGGAGGVFADTPSPELIETLDALFARAACHA